MPPVLHSSQTILRLLCRDNRCVFHKSPLSRMSRKCEVGGRVQYSSIQPAPYEPYGPTRSASGKGLALLPWHRRSSYEPDAPAREVPQSPRWRVGLVCARMRNFLNETTQG